MELYGTPFKNSETCEGVSFSSPEAPLDIATITVKGRYPEKGWAQNEVVHEMVYVSKGSGLLLYENGETIELEPGTVVHVEPQQWFAWHGDIELIMACQPAFNPEQYKIKE